MMNETRRRFRRPARRISAILTTLFAAVALAACGGGSSSSTPTPDLPTATVAPQPTLAPGQTTAGALADKISAAWASVTTIRQTSTTTFTSATPEATPEGSDDSYVVTTEVDASGNKRITVTTLGVQISQLISIRGQIWVWGYYASWGIPDTAVTNSIGDGWMVVDTSGSSDSAQFNQLILDLQSPYPVIYSDMDATLRSRVIDQTRTFTMDGRSCTEYRIPTTTSTGQSYDVFTSVDTSGLPCEITTDALGQVQTNTYEFNSPFTIEAPAPTSATPAAGASPEASPNP